MRRIATSRAISPFAKSAFARSFVRGDDWLSPSAPSTRRGGREAGAGAFANEVALELGEGAEHVEYEPAAGRRGVDRLGQRSQPGTALFQLVYGLDQMWERTRKAIELPGDENIALSHEGESLRQARTICLAPDARSAKMRSHPAARSASS